MKWLSLICGEKHLHYCTFRAPPLMLFIQILFPGLKSLLHSVLFTTMGKKKKMKCKPSFSPREQVGAVACAVSDTAAPKSVSLRREQCRHGVRFGRPACTAWVPPFPVGFFPRLHFVPVHSHGRVPVSRARAPRVPEGAAPPLWPRVPRGARVRGGPGWRRRLRPCWAGPRAWGWWRPRAGGGSSAAGRERRCESGARALSWAVPSCAGPGARRSDACLGASARISARSGPSPPISVSWWTTGRLLGKKTQVRGLRGRGPAADAVGSRGSDTAAPQNGAVACAPRVGWAGTARPGTASGTMERGDVRAPARLFIHTSPQGNPAWPYSPPARAYAVSRAS